MQYELAVSPYGRTTIKRIATGALLKSCKMDF
jgi:hypothetical protein